MMSKYQEMTPLQRKIYDLIVLQGDTSKKIAKRLGRSHSTIENNIEILLDKFGVVNQKELIIQHYTDIIKEYKKLCPNVIIL
jgi:DNA-binding CsgD family transcriptional regulator